MAVKTQTRKRTVKSRTPARRGGKTIKSRGNGNAKRVLSIFVPLFFIACIVFCLGFLLLAGYRTVTASNFFDTKMIDVRGTNRSPREEMEKIVRAETIRSGVWNADLESIRAQIEKMAYVKTVAVSRVLPDGIQVRVEERIPRAVASVAGGEFWVDDDAAILGAPGKSETRPNFILKGLDETKTERAGKDNRERIKLFQRMQAEWQDLGISNRVQSIDLTNIQEPQALVEDSGATVIVYLGKEDFGKRLQKALDFITGKGDKIESLVSHGADMRAKYRNS